MEVGPWEYRYSLLNCPFEEEKENVEYRITNIECRNGGEIEF